MVRALLVEPDTLERARLRVQLLRSEVDLEVTDNVDDALKKTDECVVIGRAGTLLHVRDRAPESVRVACVPPTGFVAIEEALPVAHDFYYDESDGHWITGVLVRCDRILRERTPIARATLESFGALPARPKLLLRVETLIESGRDLVEIGALMAQDLGLSAQLMAVANLAAFGATPVQSVPEAIRRIGLSLVRGLVVSHELVKRSSDPRQRMAVERIHRHAQAVSERAAGMADRGYVRAALLAGWLHDIGKLALLSRFPDHASVLDEEDLGREREQFGVDHATLGAMLLESWSFRPEIISAVRHHRDPLAAKPEHVELATYVFIADEIERGNLADGQPTAH